MIKLNFSVGDYVDTRINGYAFIVDVLKSETSKRVIVCAEFTCNFPNPKGFDMIVVEPGKTAGTERWIAVDKSLFDGALVAKVASLATKADKRINLNK